MSERNVYAVIARTDDYYDNGQVHSLFTTRMGAEAAAASLMHTQIDAVGTIIETRIEEMPVGAPQQKTMPCRYCEKLIVVGIRQVNPPAHIECAIKRSIDTMMQMSRKEGPDYERWKGGMRAFARRELGMGREE